MKTIDCAESGAAVIILEFTVTPEGSVERFEQVLSRIREAVAVDDSIQPIEVTACIRDAADRVLAAARPADPDRDGEA